MIFSNNPDLFSSVSVEAWPSFTDHKIVTAFTSFELGSDPQHEEVRLLDCGRRLKKLNFNKAAWVEIQAELGEIEWGDMEDAAKASHPTQALASFMEELVPLLERHVPAKQPRKKSRNKIDRLRKLCWRRLAKVKEKIKTATSIHKLTKLLQDKSDLEQQLLDDYAAVNFSKKTRQSST